MAQPVMPDINLDACSLVICGINPSPRSAQTGAPYATPGNRFWPALYRAGILVSPIDASQGLDAAALGQLRELGIGFTRVVSRPTRAAAQLTREEILAGGQEMERKISTLRRRHPPLPITVLVLGLGVYRVAFRRPRATPGLQPDHAIGGAVTWLAPNPSGLNAHETVDSLAAAYAEVWADHRGRLAELASGQTSSSAGDS